MLNKLCGVVHVCQSYDAYHVACYATASPAFHVNIRGLE